ncbi:MAG: hypothetical protein IPG17_29745, partial [Sandaracinaceae bacterium]|nr:hypothetical protein [Sandaracinaceae bacterium]
WQNWNTYSSWDTQHEVARDPVEEPDGQFIECTHPWVVPDQTGYDRIRMYLHCGDSGAAPPVFEIWSLISTEEVGADFGLLCQTSPGCDADGDPCVDGEHCDWEDTEADGGAAVKQIGADGRSGSWYLDLSGHGRIVWDYVWYGGSTSGSDEPGMMFGPGVTSCLNDDGGPYQPPGSAWEVPTDSGCPEAGSPTTMILHRALPTEEYKMHKSRRIDPVLRRLLRRHLGGKWGSSGST